MYAAESVLLWLVIVPQCDGGDSGTRETSGVESSPYDNRLVNSLSSMS